MREMPRPKKLRIVYSQDIAINFVQFLGDMSGLISLYSFRRARAGSEAPPPARSRAETSKNIFFSLIEKMGVARKSGKAKKTFLWGVTVSGTAAGRLHWGFCSK